MSCTVGKSHRPCVSGVENPLSRYKAVQISRIQGVSVRLSNYKAHSPVRLTNRAWNGSRRGQVRGSKMTRLIWRHQPFDMLLYYYQDDYG